MTPTVAVYGLEHRLTLVVDERIRSVAYRTPWGWHVPRPHQRGRVAWTACPDKATAAALLYSRGAFLAKGPAVAPVVDPAVRAERAGRLSWRVGSTTILKGAPWIS